MLDSCDFFPLTACFRMQIRKILAYVVTRIFSYPISYVANSRLSTTAMHSDFLLRITSRGDFKNDI